SDSEETIPAGLVLTSVGYRGVPVPGVPFDPDSATIPHREGRVLDSPGGPEVDGLYVVGWIKRGPRGFIGSNKSCARESVNSLLRAHPRSSTPCSTAAWPCRAPEPLPRPAPTTHAHDPRPAIHDRNGRAHCREGRAHRGRGHVWPQ